jgi:hypothetical protein
MTELTAEDRELAIEAAATSYSDEWVRRQILAAATDAEAATTARAQLRWWGSWGGGLRVNGGPKGLVVSRGGRSGLIRWSEVVRHVRRGVVAQLALF